MLAEATALLRSIAQPLMSPADTVAVLRMVERLLVARLTALGAPPAENAPSPPAAPASNDNADNAEQDRTAAALHRVNEAFIGSSMFKVGASVVIALVVAAVLLAGGGTVFVAGQSVTLRRDLNDTAADATRKINDISATAQTALSKQTEQLKIAKDSTDALQASYEAKVTESLNAIKGLAKQAEEDAVPAAMAAVKANLSSKTSTIEAAIQQAGDEMAGRLAILKPGIDTVSGSVATLQSQVKDTLQPQSQSLATSLGTLTALAERITQIKQQIDGMADYTKVVQAAQSAAEAAKAFREQAADAKTATVSLLGDLTKAVPEQTAQMLFLKHQIDQQSEAVNRDILPAVQRLRSDLDRAHVAVCPQSDGEVDATRRVVDCLRKRIEDLDPHGALPAPQSAQPPPPQPQASAPLTDPGLPAAQWLRIQQYLRDHWQYRADLDGQPDDGKRPRARSGTGQAIRRWQASLHIPQSGYLSPTQIDQLVAQGVLTR